MICITTFFNRQIGQPFLCLVESPLSFLLDPLHFFDLAIQNLQGIMVLRVGGKAHSLITNTRFVARKSG